MIVESGQGKMFSFMQGNKNVFGLRAYLVFKLIFLYAFCGLIVVGVYRR